MNDATTMPWWGGAAGAVEAACRRAWRRWPRPGLLVVVCLGLSGAVGVAAGAEVSFRTGILPILTKAGCNAGACHGAATGQGGFRLSLLGYDPEEDRDRLARELGARRIDVTDPESSLVLRKASGDLDHDGGRRLPKRSEGYERLRDWIAAGAPRGPADLTVTALAVEPSDTLVDRVGGDLVLRATATLSDGTREDVTRLALYDTNDDAVAGVDKAGRVTLRGRGLTSIMVRYSGQVAAARVAVPWGDAPGSGAGAGAGAVRVGRGEVVGIDTFVERELERLRLPVGRPSGSGEFLRRVHLDVLGRLPALEETRAYLEGEDSTGRREALVGGLLEREEFIDYWTLKLADLFLVGPRRGHPEVAARWHGWLRAQVAGRVPLDRMVREMLTAEGDPKEVGPAGFYLLAGDPRDMAEQVGSMLLGTRLACARCHAHPADRWTQDDYHRFAAYFARVTREGGVVRVVNRGEVDHPKTGRPVEPRPLGSGVEAGAGEASGDRRRELAEWVTAPGNPFFARAFVNRVWRHLMGRGLVEPVDDLRPTNPATHPALLDWLASDFEQGGYDLRRLVRGIVGSRAYQRGSAGALAEGSAGVPMALAARFHARAVPKPLPAEVYLDAVVQVTGVNERFPGVSEGTRAVQLVGPMVASPALDVLGRCSRERRCDEPAAGGGGLAQALHLINGGTLNGRLREGVVGRLLERSATPAEMVEELYLRALARRPDGEERQLWEGLLVGVADRREAAEDLLWVLLNSAEFVFNH